MNKFAIILLAILFSGTAASANVAVTYSVQEKPYFTIKIPDSWRVNVGEEIDANKVPEGELAPPRVLTMMPDDDSILWFGTWVPIYLHSMDAAQDYLSSLDNFLVDNPTLEKTDQVDLNTMPARYFKGKGEREGKPVDFFVMLFELSKNDIGIAIYIGSPDTTKTHFNELRGMLKSIAPLAQP